MEKECEIFIDSLFNDLLLHDNLGNIKNYYKDGMFILRQNMNQKLFRISYINVLDLIQTKFNIQINDILILCNNILHHKYNCNDYTTMVYLDSYIC